MGAIIVFGGIPVLRYQTLQTWFLLGGDFCDKSQRQLLEQICSIELASGISIFWLEMGSGAGEDRNEVAECHDNDAPMEAEGAGLHSCSFRDGVGWRVGWRQLERGSSKRGV